MRSSLALIAATVLVGLAAMLAHTQHDTFRLGALEYEGRTSTNWSSNSDAKMQVMYDGMRKVLIDQQQAGTPIDMLVTSETPTWVGGEDNFMAQVIPGDRTSKLSKIAIEFNTWVVSSTLEEVQDNGIKIYNTTVVFNRQGELVAKYRKVNLPPQEINGNLHPYGRQGIPITPGDQSMVVDTEFGLMALMICQDADDSLPGPAAYVAEVMSKNPHFMAHPTWGNYNPQLVQMAKNNNIYIASSAWAGASLIAGPDGVLDQQHYHGGTPSQMKVAVADIPVVPEPATLSMLVL